MSPYETNGLITNTGVEPISATDKVEITKEYTSRADRRLRDKKYLFWKEFFLPITNTGVEPVFVLFYFNTLERQVAFVKSIVIVSIVAFPTAHDVHNRIVLVFGVKI